MKVDYIWWAKNSKACLNLKLIVGKDISRRFTFNKRLGPKLHRLLLAIDATWYSMASHVLLHLMLVLKRPLLLRHFLVTI